MIIVGQDTAHDNGDRVGCACFLESLHDLFCDLGMGAAQDGKADQVGAFFDGALYDIVGRKADSCIDHIESEVSGGDGDHLGPVGMSVESGFSDEYPRPMSESFGESVDTVLERDASCFVEGECLSFDAGGCAVFAEDGAEGICPFACGDASECALDGSGHHILPVACGLLESLEGGLDFFGIALFASLLKECKGFVCGVWIDAEQAAVLVGHERRGQGVCPAIDADDDLFTALDAANACGHRAHQRTFHVAAVDGSVDAAHALDAFDLFACFGFDRFGFGLDDRASVEEVGIFEEIRFIREDLLKSQRPLLIPRSGKGEGFVPCGELECAAAGFSAECYAEGFDQDAPCVVFGLLFGQAEGVDLDTVAKASKAGILDVVARERDLVPEFDKCAHLTHLFDKADASVDKKADTFNDLIEVLFVDLLALLQDIKNTDGGGEGKGDFLCGCGASFLEVVRADIRGVPFGEVLEAVFVHLGDDAKVSIGWKKVSSTCEIFFDDIVLCGSAQGFNGDSAFLGERDVEGEQPHGCAVDGHGSVHLFERYRVEESVHIVEAVDGDTDFADFAFGEGMIAVVAALGGEIKGDGESRLSLCEILSVELVGGVDVGVSCVGAKDPRSVGCGFCVAIKEPMFGGVGRLGHDRSFR